MLTPRNQDFVETNLFTKFGQFNIRVYPDLPNKETVVLTTKNLDTSSPVLVRVHSECLTGDIIGSLQCDCGKQLSQSLQRINAEGGVLIYLRQEGRGIGLYEKIKTYQLQSKGYDTFEANVLLGHRPDGRSYEMVQTILEDLNIKKIRLLTNNPSKISEIAKLGIEVVEAVPVMTTPNKHNKAYLSTKRKKFQHFKSDSRYYFYQFQADTADQVIQIGEFMRGQTDDPKLKICIGVAANRLTLDNDQEINRMHSIFQACNEFENFIPVLHFSFRNSLNIEDDVQKIKHKMPFVNRIQVNDLQFLGTASIKLLSAVFSVDIPLSDENFDLIHNKQFRTLISKNGSYILLDNSQGKGIEEPIESLRKKIDVLLAYGLNDIALCGGFGPDQLDRYFDVKRYYRINFSIDAETKLKTNGKVDIDKVKLYLTQLIRFDDPKQDGIDQTKKFLNQHRRADWETVLLNQIEFSVHPDVFHPGHFPASGWCASKINSLVANDVHFCEVGCGSGVVSSLVALANPNLHVTATDISPHATENTKLNAEKHNLSKRLEVFTGDVLDSLETTRQFDTIFWLLPFGFLDPGSKINLEETQVFDPGYRAIRKFFQTAKQFLKPNGKLLIGFSSDLGHPKLLRNLAKESKIKLTKIDEATMSESESIKFEIYSGTYFD